MGSAFQKESGGSVSRLQARFQSVQWLGARKWIKAQSYDDIAKKEPICYAMDAFY